MRVPAVLLLACALGANAATLPIGTSTPLPFPGVPDRTVTLGSDGNIWIIESAANKIGRLTPSGEYTGFPIPTARAGPAGMALGADGNVWFTENMASKIGRITPDGVITEFMPPTMRNSDVIAAGPDGTVWFSAGNKLGRLTIEDGRIDEFTIPGVSSGFAGAMAEGPDRNLWVAYAQLGGSTPVYLLLRVTPSGAMTKFPMPGPAPQTGFGDRMIVGPDLNLWVGYANNLARVKVDGTVTLYPIPTPNAQPRGLEIDTTGNLRFAELRGGKIGQLIVASATDSGQATINESEVIGDWIRDVILLPPGPDTSPGALRTLAGEECPLETFLIQIWESPNLQRSELKLIRQVAAAKCADLDIRLTAIRDEDARVVTNVTNLGPHPAENVRGTVFTLRPAGASRRIEHDFGVLAKGAVLKAETVFIPPPEVFDAVVTSVTSDPKPANNRHRAWFTGRFGRLRTLPATPTDPIALEIR